MSTALKLRRRIVSDTGRFIGRDYGDGRGMLADRLGIAVEPDFRDYLRRAADAAGTTVADLVRSAAEERAAAILNGLRGR